MSTQCSMGYKFNYWDQIVERSGGRLPPPPPPPPLPLPPPPLYSLVKSEPSGLHTLWSAKSISYIYKQRWLHFMNDSLCISYLNFIPRNLRSYFIKKYIDSLRNITGSYKKRTNVYKYAETYRYRYMTHFEAPCLFFWQKLINCQFSNCLI